MKKNLLQFFKITGVVAVVFGLCFSNFTASIAAAPEPADLQGKMENLRKLINGNSNYLQYTEYQMLKHKLSQGAPQDSNDYSNEYYMRPSGASPLSREYYGGAAGPETSTTFDGVDVITGARAINESLQLGSIGSGNASTFMNANLRQIQNALEVYFTEYNKYPDTLGVLVPEYMRVIPAGFVYKKTAKSYELTIGDDAQAEIKVSDIKSLQIKSHPWESMIKNTPEVPGVFSLIPADYFSVYISNMSKFSQLEETLKTLGKPLESMYGITGAVNAKDKIFQRLGIKDNEKLRSLIDEVAFVSYDLDPYPNTNYALIIKVKSSLLNGFISDFISTPKDRQGSVGDYYVIATNKNTLDVISKTFAEKNNSLAQKKDALYTLSVLEKNYDGLVYFSEDFVKKMTSPAYRINARRRNTILKALESLQYSVFAYREITGTWPASISQMVSEGYLAANSVANVEAYSITQDGIVNHNVWGSVYNVFAVDDVAITTVNSSEEALYESFKQGYEQYWREYIDPIGIAITAGDNIKIHTIILPLIEKSEYNWIKDIAGGDGIPFHFLSNPDRIPSVQGLMKLNVDDAIYAYYKETAQWSDPVYTKCRSDYYSDITTTSSSHTKTVEETCVFTEKNKEGAVASVKDRIAKAIGWNEKTAPLDFIGNEITLAGGENLNFSVNDLSSLDVYLGLTLKDTELTKKFIDEVFQWYAKQQSDGDSSVGYGFLKLENNKPLKNTYNGMEYYIVPLGFTNVYYAFIGDRMYFTVSQSALNKIMDGDKKVLSKAKDAPVWSPSVLRMFDYLGDKSNISFLVDNTKLQVWLKQVIKDNWFSYSGAHSVNEIVNYYTEALTLAKSLPGYDGTISNTSKYFTNPSTKWFDADVFSKNGKVYLKVKDKEYDLATVDTGYRYSYDDYQDDTPKTKLSDITKEFDIEKSLAEWQKLNAFGISFNLSGDGLDITIAFTNTASTGFDSRIPQTHKKPFSLNKMFVYGGVGVFILLFGFIGWWFGFKKRKEIGVGSSVASETGAQGEPPVIPSQ